MNKCFDPKEVNSATFKFLNGYLCRMIQIAWNSGVSAGSVRNWEYGTIFYNANLQVSDRVLDIGSGGTLWPCLLASIGIEVYSVDLKPVEDRDDLNEVYKIGVRNFEMNAEKLDFPDEFFDHVTIISVLEHVEDDALAMKEAARVLKSHGRISLTVDFAKKAILWPRGRRDIFHDETVEASRLYDFQSLLSLIPKSMEAIGGFDYSFKLEENTELSELEREVYTMASLFLEKKY